MNYDRIKKNYKSRLFNKQMVRKAYETNVISIAQYYSIVKEFEDEDVPEGITKEQFEEALIDTCKKIGIWEP